MDSIQKTNKQDLDHSREENPPLGPLSPSKNPSPDLHQERKSPKWLLVFFGTMGILTVAAALMIGFLAYESLNAGENMRFESKGSTSFVSEIRRLSRSFLTQKKFPLQAEKNGRINILLLGRAGEHYPGRNLTDTIIILSIDTKTRNVALLSLPRDLYVPIGSTGLYSKINSIYQYGLTTGDGVDPLKETVEHITGQPIHYFVTIDFDGFEKAIDTLGGIQVNVPRDFYDTRYPGKNYSYETFDLKQGWQSLDGATALKYVRERHDDPEGDFGRAKRQQQVIQAIKDEVLSLGTFLNIFKVHELLDTLGESVKTDIAFEEVNSFFDLAKTLNTNDANAIVIDAWRKESLLRVSHIQVGAISAFILVPRVGNWSEIHDVSKNIFNLAAMEERKALIAKEKATVTLLRTPEDSLLAERMARLIRDEMGFKNLSVGAFSSFENRPEESMIVDRSDLSKPFSLDELLKKFALKKVDSLPLSLRASLPSKNTSDFVIVLGEDLREILSLEEENTSALIKAGETNFSEPLPPQPKQGKYRE